MADDFSQAKRSGKNGSPRTRMNIAGSVDHQKKLGENNLNRTTDEVLAPTVSPEPYLVRYQPPAPRPNSSKRKPAAVMIREREPDREHEQQPRFAMVDQEMLKLARNQGLRITFSLDDSATTSSRPARFVGCMSPAQIGCGLPTPPIPSTVQGLETTQQVARRPTPDAKSEPKKRMTYSRAAKKRASNKRQALDDFSETQASRSVASTFVRESVMNSINSILTAFSCLPDDDGSVGDSLDNTLQSTWQDSTQATSRDSYSVDETFEGTFDSTLEASLDTWREDDRMHTIMELLRDTSFLSASESDISSLLTERGSFLWQWPQKN